MRQMSLTGRLTKDPELRELESKLEAGKMLKRLTFRIANNDNGKEKDPEFFDVTCWDNLAIWGEQYLKKGTRVLLSGIPHNEIFDGKDGQKHFHFKDVADKIELIG